MENMPILPANTFVYGYVHNGDLIYIGKTINIVDRFIDHFNQGGAFACYLRYLAVNEGFPSLVIFGYYDKRIATIKERSIIKTNADCNFLLNFQFREHQYKNSKFVKYVYKLAKDIHCREIKVPEHLKTILTEIQTNYTKRYATNHH